MNKRGQRETSGALGDFCVKCHAPMAVIDGKTTDGLNLGDLDAPYHGVTCFFCHTVESVTGTHNATLSLSNDQSPKMRGEYSDPLANKVHDSAYSSFFDRNQPVSSAVCGACHDIIVRDSNAFIERTFCEWAHSAFNAPHDKDGSSCVECHMDASSDKIAQVPNVVTREYHKHDWPGVDVPLNATDGIETAAVQGFLTRTFQGALCVTQAGGIRVILDPVNTGHEWPSGSAQDRRPIDLRQTRPFSGLLQNARGAAVPPGRPRRAGLSAGGARSCHAASAPAAGWARCAQRFGRERRSRQERARQHAH
jgi:nitrate/TMAO reductase-like tetraheme cytochrome c subunit